MASTGELATTVMVGESNHRHEDFQSSALPTELRNHHLAVWTGLEPATSAVTGRHSNQLNYQNSNLFKWWFRAESNHRHEDFQSSALPTELRNHHLAVWTGLEPATSAVTGRHSNQLNYQTKK